jgi:hypothetical protein
MKKVIIGAVLFFVSGFIAQPVWAKVSSQAVKEKAPTFPVAQLGNCRDRKECFYYCEIPSHQNACLTYGNLLRGKNVLGTTTTTVPPVGPLSKITYPVSELGNCASYADCRAYCNLEQNHSACLAFEQTQTNRSTGNIQQIIQAAKTILGCDYATTCHTFCNIPENQQKCTNFFTSFYKQNNPAPSTKSASSPPSTLGLSVMIGDLMSVDCTLSINAAKCRNAGTVCGNFCQKNPGLCKSGSLPVPSHSPTPTRRPSQTGANSSAILDKLKKATGCTSPQDCSTYCQSHVDFCKGIIYGSTPTHAPTP